LATVSIPPHSKHAPTHQIINRIQRNNLSSSHNSIFEQLSSYILKKMKFTVLATLLSSSAAFAPSIRTTTSITYFLQSSVTTENAPTEVSAVAETRPVYDPFGLYPTNSEELENGRMQALEPSNIDSIEATKPILDPLRIYSNSEAGDKVFMSESLPFLPRPALLDQTMAGDVGFDPFNFAGVDAEKLYTRREAEVKHGRIAMLAALGWPLSELLDKPIAHVFNLPAVLGHGDKVPSLLNGGLETISPLYWATVLALAGGLEAWSMSKEASPLAGDYGFDPFGFYPKDDAGQARMQLAEIKNGRLAMMAITGFAYQELFTNNGVIHSMQFLH